MNKTNTRRAFFLSLVSLMLCFSMMLGTTFAWFTDNVTIENNRIVAGNLDVELFYKNGNMTDFANAMTAGAKMFVDSEGNDILWEPGVVAYTNFQIKNVGNLALKYAMNAVVKDETTTTVDGVELSLQDVIKVAVLPEDTVDSREEAIAKATASGIRFDEIATNGDLLPAGNILNEKEYDECAVILYWAPNADDIDNKYNLNNKRQDDKDLDITFDIRVVAAQLTYEDDSFGDDYDTDSALPGNSTSSVLGDNPITLTTAGGNGATVVLPASLVKAIDDGSITSLMLHTSLPSVETGASGEVEVEYSIFEVVDQDGNEIDFTGNTTAISVEIYVGTEYAGKNATVYHDGVAIANTTVDAEGYVSYNTTHFCEITVLVADKAPETGMDDVKDENAEDLTKLVEVLVGNHFYTVSQGMANSWKTLSNDEQIVADIYVPEDLIAYAMMYNNGDITADTGVHSDLTLMNDLDFENYNWVSIGRFYTNIHGNEKTISNLSDSFLGCVYDCQIDSLTLENVNASGSAAGVVAKELAGDIYIKDLTIIGENTVTYIDDNATNWPEEGTGVGAICGISLIGCGGYGEVDITVDGSIEVNYNEVFFGNNTNLENLGVSEEFGLNVYKENANANVTVTDDGSITVNGTGYLFDKADLEDGFALDTLSGNCYVFTAEGLAAFAEEVNGGNSFSKKTVVLYNDVDLENKEWTPIGNDANKFSGTFDGNDNTVSNLYINTVSKSNVGLFGFTKNGEIKNLTVEDAKVTGYLNVGVVAGTPYTSKYNNITVTGHVEVNGFSYVGAAGGKNAYANWNDIVVDTDETSYVKACSVSGETAYRTYVGGVIGFMGEGTHKVTNVKSDIDVIGSTCDVGGIVGIAHEGNSFENIVCTGDVKITDAAEAADAEEIGGIAGVWMNSGRNVTFNNCKFTGKLETNITEGVDLSNNTVVGKGYYATTSNKLIIDGKEVVVLVLPEEEDVNVMDVINETLTDNTNGYISIETDVKGDADKSNSYGSTGVTVTGGQTIDGNGNTFSVTDCDGTWDSAINITGGTIKNITIDSGFRGIFINHNSDTYGKVYLENVIIDGPVYTISCDQGTNSGLEAVNCTFNGWTSYAATLGDVKFVDCSFGYGAGYEFARPYAPTEFVGCEFSADYKIDARAAVTFENCTFGGVAVTADNLAELVPYNTANASLK